MRDEDNLGRHQQRSQKLIWQARFWDYFKCYRWVFSTSPDQSFASFLVQPSQQRRLPLNAGCQLPWQWSKLQSIWVIPLWCMFKTWFLIYYVFLSCLCCKTNFDLDSAKLKQKAFVDVKQAPLFCFYVQFYFHFCFLLAFLFRWFWRIFSLILSEKYLFLL